MKVKYKDSIEYKALQRLKKIRGNVVLRKDFDGLGSYRQISRVLNKLIAKIKIIKIGMGVFARAYFSENINKPVIQNGFDQACREALTKLGVQWEPGSAEKAYNARLSTQVPVRMFVCLKSRFRGHLNYGDRKLLIERGINAR